MHEPNGRVMSVLIVGCGNIAGGYDEMIDNDRVTQTHAGAYRSDVRFQIAACVEPNSKRRAEFMDHWDVPVGFECLEDCHSAGASYDVASVCVPTHLHGDVLEMLLTMSVRAVLAEKPLTGTVVRSRAIVSAYEEAGRPLMVNFQRRFDNHIFSIRNEIIDGDWGSVQTASAYYAKGLVNCGSHAIDLLMFLLGPLRPIAVTEIIHDYRREDPTLSARLETSEARPVYLIGCDSRMHFPFEVDIIFEKGRVTVEDLGYRLRRRRLRPHPLFLHQVVLDDGVWVNTELPNALPNAVTALHDHLNEGTPFVSDGISALATEEICGALMELVQTKIERE